jgi:hypothetical protein
MGVPAKADDADTFGVGTDNASVCGEGAITEPVVMEAAAREKTAPNTEGETVVIPLGV